MKQPPERAAVFVGDQWLPVFVCNLIFSFSFREKGKRTAFSFCFSKKKTPGKRKKRPGKPFGWFPRTLSIDQSLALDLRRMEVGKSTIEYVGGDEGIGPYKVQRKIEGCGRTESSTPTNAAKDVWEIHCGGE